MMHESHHYIVCHNTGVHYVAHLLSAGSLGEAIRNYCLEECAKAELLPDGSISVQGCGKANSIYTHPLACVESEFKSCDGAHGGGWDIREIRDAHWQAPVAEAFCSANIDELDAHVRACRPEFQKEFPGSRARAFVWYLKSGPLVTFYRPKSQSCRWPIKVLGRYHIDSRTWQVSKWHGSYDDILDQMATEYPEP